MNQKALEQIAKNPGKQWYYKLSEIANILGLNRDLVANFLSENSVQYYCCSKAKMYFLPDVLEAVEKTRWQDGK